MKKRASSTDLYSMIDSFLDGSSTKAYELLGCHKGSGGYTFRVWAPHAKSVSVVGDFNSWDKSAPKMRHLKGGVWEGFVENAKVYDNYQ